MEFQLDDTEARVLGCLVEKELATPEYYPLTLNALTNACNQKSNRAPVMALEETEVVRALDSLRKKQLAMQSAEGVRAAKYCHNLAGRLDLDLEEMAIMAELLLRGPQTVGELRNRAERMCQLGDLSAVEQLLQHLSEKEPPLVLRLPRQPGRKESRFAQLLTGESELQETLTPPAEPARVKATSEDNRLDHLEAEVLSLRQELTELNKEFQEFKNQFE